MTSFKRSDAHVRQSGSFATLDLEADRHKYIPCSYLYADSDLDERIVEHKVEGQLYCHGLCTYKSVRLCD